MAVSCTQTSPKQITDEHDYNVFLGSVESKKTSKYFELWNSKIQPDSMQLMSFGMVLLQVSTIGIFKKRGI